MISWQEIINIDPDYIGLIACGGNLEENQKHVEVISKMELLKNLKAVKKNNIYAFDANNYFSRPTLRVINGAEILKKRFSG
jgi:iron complex transport system substrate-binding protein